MLQIGLVGQKCGMMRKFTELGESVSVTVMKVEPNRVTQIKTVETDGYAAVQVTTGTCKSSRLNKAQAKHYAKANTEPGRGLWEFRLNTSEEAATTALGDELKVDIFTIGQCVNVRSVSRGKGFAGAVKRHNFRTQDATHGNSLSHRAPGSIGQNQTPGRVFKGKKMAGQMGNKKTTVRNLEIVDIDVERNLILVKGGVPGAPGGNVMILPVSVDH